MIASPESWSRQVDPLRAALVAVAALALFLSAWGLLHIGFYTRDQVVDTPIYQRYGDAIADGQVPYRDFALEYPPGALPVFVLPSLAAGEDDREGYERAFEVLMCLCGAGLLAAMVGVLDGLGATSLRAAGALAFAALAPLALGSVVLTRFDFWPAALSVGALALLVCGRPRLGLAVLGLAVVTKIYPAVLLPLFVAYVWRLQGRRAALVTLGVFATVVVTIALPFAVLGPDGFASSIGRQVSRPLQIESLGSSFLLVAHQVLGLAITMRSGRGSQNLAGTGPDVLAVLTSVLQAAAVIAIWVWFARGPAQRERLIRASAAALCAFVTFGKVFSPQFLIWLVPFVPLVRGRRGLAASAVLAAALVVTQTWFPFRYWDLALQFDPAASWLVFARDLTMLGLVGVLLWPERPRPGSDPGRGS
jgi:glycosyl transferase family 87